MSERLIEEAREILWKDFVDLRCVRKMERGVWIGVLVTSLRIWVGGVVRRRVRFLNLVVGESSVSVLEEGGSLAVVSQMPGWVGGSVREGMVGVEVIGGICRDKGILGDKVTEAMREAEIDV